MAAPGAAAAEPAEVGWLPLPRLYGRITAQELGLVINTADPYSVTVGEHYARRRGIPPGQILRVQLPVRASLTREEFTALDEAIRSRMPTHVQGLALAWVQPYAVDCNALTSALAQGLEPDLCAHSCAATRITPYVGYAGARPWSVLGMRLAMQLAARSVPAALAMIERGIAADHTLAAAPAERAMAYLAATPDAARNVRERLFPPAGPVPGAPALDVARVRSDALPAMRRILVYETGLPRVPAPLGGEWLPGALADHLTSFGGLLDKPAGEGQMTVLDWIDAGATASYGAVSEPCNHLQKFPHPQVLIQAYAQGISALEAYWHSVAWPAQGVFVGEPLAAPFAPLSPVAASATSAAAP
ncbi:TIGR03790 family protein [Pelomonas cellulosilytica]|uniref:TIGR03790 family protein n=1 Tax=Pelomonas cellulosilytica TaxID=2906762 RepID=A0ABS8XRR9_9BURK|nr:TIGR03790 family protein [Pelomonas sp. P8]MCE4553296.1 TIGR03790 family protein [Pelomonas sp. P8]